jgi:hypothetical protein
MQKTLLSEVCFCIMVGANILQNQLGANDLQNQLGTVRVRICLILNCAFASRSMSRLLNLFIVFCYDL